MRDVTLDSKRRLTARYETALRNERGVALLVAVAAMAVLAIVVGAALSLSSSASRNASYQAADHKATAVAEAGLNEAQATLAAAADPRNPAALPAQTMALEAGTTTFSGSYTPATETWTLTATGTMPNPSGGEDLVSTVANQVAVRTRYTGAPTSTIWSYLYSWDPTLCSHIRDDSRIEAPFYVNGPLCLAGDGQLTGNVLQANSTVTLEGTSAVGTSSAQIQEAHVQGGCRTDDSDPFHPCSSGDRVHAQILDASPAPIVRPPMNLDYWYAASKPGPQSACTSGSFNSPTGFDNNGAHDRSLGTVNLTPASSYTCEVRDGSGALLGQLGWNASTGVLSVAGTIFIDGNLVVEDTHVVYEGRATIYAAGHISLLGEAQLCGVSDCGTSWDPEQDLLTLVAGEPTQWWGFRLWGNTKYQGAIYSERKFWTQSNAEVWGPVIARYLWFEGTTKAHHVPIGSLSPGMPADGGWATELVRVPGSFQG